jgi:hypothetical protein
MLFQTPEEIASKILVHFPRVDPARITRALDLVNSHAITTAKRDEKGAEILPTWEILEMPGSQCPYIVRKGSCTCPDNLTGHICKHRIAAYIFREIMASCH